MSNYLTPAEVEKQEPLAVSIVAVKEDFVTHKNATEPKIVIGFEETDSWLSLNDENYRRIVKLTGTHRWETKWIGTVLFLITEDVKVQGMVKKGIRVKIK